MMDLRKQAPDRRLRSCLWKERRFLKFFKKTLTPILVRKNEPVGNYFVCSRVTLAWMAALATALATAWWIMGSRGSGINSLSGVWLTMARAAAMYISEVMRVAWLSRVPFQMPG